MILGLKHVGAILNVLMWNFYVCASVGILSKYFDDMHGAAIRIISKNFPCSFVNLAFSSRVGYVGLRFVKFTPVAS